MSTKTRIEHTLRTATSAAVCFFEIDRDGVVVHIDPQLFTGPDLDELIEKLRNVRTLRAALANVES